MSTVHCKASAAAAFQPHVIPMEIGIAQEDVYQHTKWIFFFLIPARMREGRACISANL